MPVRIRRNLRFRPETESNSIETFPVFILLLLLLFRRRVRPDVLEMRKQFSYFDEERPIYLDNAATSLKPRLVVESLKRTYAERVSNVHRGVCENAQKTTENFEAARARIRRFLNAQKDDQIVFTKNATEGINLVARGSKFSCVLTSQLEHHANLLPWLKNSKVVLVKLDENLDFDYEDLEKLLKENEVDLISLAHVSNVLGTKLDVPRLVSLRDRFAKKAKILLDGCQSVLHERVDVEKLGCDFFVFSGHKCLGPSVGVLYGKNLNELEPLLLGGEMIERVSFSGYELADSPRRFEAGTPAIAETLALAESINFVEENRDFILERLLHLQEYLYVKLSQVPGVKIYGPRKRSGGLVAFNIDGVHAFDLAILTDALGSVCFRAGHHCCQPLHEEVLLVPGSCRFSVSFYNTEEEIDRAIEALKDASKILKT